LDEEDRILIPKGSFADFQTDPLAPHLNLKQKLLISLEIPTILQAGTDYTKGWIPFTTSFHLRDS